VGLDERVEVQLPGERHQAGGGSVVEIAKQEQNGVRAEQLQLGDLVRVAEEAFGEERQRRPRPRGRQVLGRTAEALVDQHRDRRCARSLEVTRQPGRVRVRP
jgi:hypothetical protein